jgi:hypothetical protein
MRIKKTQTHHIRNTREGRERERERERERDSIVVVE